MKKTWDQPQNRDHKHQFRQKDLSGSNLLSRITAHQESLLSLHNYKIRIG